MMNTAQTSQPSILICGGSIFDNAPYVAEDERCVRDHLSGLLPDWHIDFRALDGAISTDVAEFQLPDAGNPDAIALSVGGNNALEHLSLLFDPGTDTFLQTALKLDEIQTAFRHGYRTTIGMAASLKRPLLAATIYRPRYHLDGYPREVTRAIEPLLSVFNDVIQEEARRVGADLLDLRAFCIDDEDFANPIEPSHAGGAKIAKRIAEWATNLA